jgi:hypothetical protein
MLDHVKLEIKLIGGFEFVVLLTTLIGATSLIDIRRMAQADRGLYADAIAPLPELTQIAVSVQRMRIASRDVIGSEGKTSRQTIFARQVHQLSCDVANTSDMYGRHNLSLTGGGPGRGCQPSQEYIFFNDVA